MKKISYKIILFTILVSLILTLSMSIVSIGTSRGIIVSKTHEILELIPHKYTKGIIHKIEASSYTIATMETIIEYELDNFDFENGNKEILLETINKKFQILLKKNDVYWIYAYFTPEFLDLGTGISIRKKGNIINIEEAGNPKTFKKDNSSYSWYFDTIKLGEAWTDSYDQESEALMISHNRAIKYKGKTIGILGTNINFVSLQEEILTTKIGESGYAYLMNKNFDFLVHPNLAGRNLKEFDENLAQNIKDTLINSTAEEIVLEYQDNKGNKKIGVFSKIDTGHIIAFAPMYEEIFAPIKILTNKILLISIVAIILSGILAYFIGTLISKPLLSFIKDFDTLSKGDFTVLSEVNTKDELKDLSIAFNFLVKKLSETIGGIKTTFTHILNENTKMAKEIDKLLKGSNNAEDIETLKKFMGEAMDNVRNQTASVEETLAGLEEISATAEEMQRNASLTLQISNRSTTEANSSIKNLDELSNQMNNIKRNFNSATTSVQELTTLSNDISSIAVSINAISEQTNLLALNAAIEAARAGDAGRGFAVVAEEIKKLAEKTNEETGKIDGIIKEIQVKVEEVNKANGEVDISLTTGVSINEEVNLKIKEIVNILGESNDSIKDISTAIQEQNISTEEISKAVSSMADSATEIENKETNNYTITEKISEELERKILELDEFSTLLKELDEKLNQFKIRE